MGGCADAPWLPADTLATVEAAGAGAQLVVSLPREFLFSGWWSFYAAARDRAGERIHELGEGGDGEQDGMREAIFSAPPSGDWVVAVTLTFAAADGSATYYWRVVVP